MSTTQDIDSAITAAVRCNESADALNILAGAAQRVDSGLPDYRGHEGQWCAWPGLKY